MSGSPIFEKDMSSLRRVKKLVAECNLLLAREMGRNPHGLGIYEWKYSEDWIRTKRSYSIQDDQLIPEFEYKANRDDGIIEAHPKYVREKVCVTLQNQWLMSIWLPSEDFAEWRAKYGDSLEWPKQGEYWPVSHPTGVVCLDPNMAPTSDITWEFIYQAKKDRGLSDADFESDYDKKTKAKDDAMSDRLMGTIMNVLPVYEGIPGSRSYPTWPIAGTHVDSRIADPTKIFKE